MKYNISNKSYRGGYMKTKQIAYVAVLAALTCVLTAYLQYPLANRGYIHVGDSIIILAAILFGKRAGALVGAIGSTLADIISGAAIWAPYTFVIKLVLGYLSGVANEKKGKMKAGIYAICGIILIAGYYLAEVIITSGNFIAPLYSIYGSVIQYILSLIIGILLGRRLERYVR